MGSYLDKPETTKKSAIDENDYFLVGSSSMQGWRINQEDAHNAIPSYGDKVAFFAVYDGHGGSEVAEYCSMKLPDFLKNLESFKRGDYEQALKDAFIGFDATLLQDTVVEELRQMARKNPDYEESDMDMEDEETAEEIIDLHQEASMSLSEVLEKYKGKKEGGSKVQTVHRMIHMHSHTKISQKDGPSSSSSASIAPGPSSAAPDNEVSSSSSGKPSDNETEAPSSSQQPTNTETQAPDSTHTIPAETQPQKEPDQSKTVEITSDYTVVETSSSNGEVANEAISSSQENGEISATATSSTNSAGNSSSGEGAAGSSSGSSASRIPNSTISSSDGGNAEDTDSMSSTDDEHDETYKESPGKKNLPLDSDDDTTDEDIDEEELSNEEISGEEDEDDELDDDFINNMETGPGKASGCTAVVALLVGRELYVANAGDSRCVVCRGGKVVEMSFDHKPEDDIEFQRIRKAGGRVTLDGRVNGGLNLSRAIGDHGYKMNKDLPAHEQMISALPDLKCLTLEPEDEFMVLACDGIWNYMTNEEVVGFVKQRIEQGKLTLAQICEELFHNCLAPNTMGDGTGCDNMTAIIVKFKPALYELPTPATSQVTDTNNAETKIARKRSAAESEPDQAGEAEALVEPSDKRAKIEDDLTPAAVDTST